MTQTKFNKGTFITIPNRCTLRELSSSAQVVYLWICDMMDDDGKCFPSHRLLCELTGLSRPTIKRAIDALVSADILEKQNRYKDNEQTTNMYFVLIKDTEKCDVKENVLTDDVSWGVVNGELGGVNVRATELNPINQTQLSKTHTPGGVAEPSKKKEPSKDTNETLKHFYLVLKMYSLPVLNNTHVRKWADNLKSSLGDDVAVGYLIRLQERDLRVERKTNEFVPQLGRPIDVIDKAGKIIDYYTRTKKSHDPRVYGGSL